MSTLTADTRGRPAALRPDGPPRHPRPHRRPRRSVTPYLLLLPAAAVYGVFAVYPMFHQFEIAFFDWHVLPGASNPFVGLSNFSRIFHDPVVGTAALNSFLFIVITVPPQMVLGLLAAAALVDKLPASALWRAIVYIPVVTSWVVVSYVFSYIFQSQGGIANDIIGMLAGHAVSVDWTAQTWTGSGIIWLLSIWKGFGWSFIIFLAALDGVPRQVLEAARVDGASELRVWRHVVLPSLRAAITFVLVLLVIGGAQVFTQVYLITKGGPYNSTQTLMTYMYYQAFTNFAFGYAAALASLLAVVLFGFSWAEIHILRNQEG